MTIQLSTRDKEQLLALAHATIYKGCKGQQTTKVSDLYKQQALFQQILATFVTLKKHNDLRGCIGSLEPSLTLVDDIMHNAYASAFYDNRFQPVTETELSDIRIEISILSPLKRLPVHSEKELLAAVVPGRDGIYLKSAQYSATFLPQVWEQLPLVTDFLAHLREKAGLMNHTWPEDMVCFQYDCTTIKE